jgi:hypothetical protein
MPRTTPPRPVDIVERFPELAAQARQTVRLHPRIGEPEMRDSSVGGPLLWPAGEPWPVCPGPHLVPQSCLSVPLNAQPTENSPNAMIPVAQLFLRDLPEAADRPGFEGTDRLQVLWCPIDHPGTYVPEVRVFWWPTTSIADHLRSKPPEPSQVQELYVPRPCVVYPEAVSELPSPLELPEELQGVVESPRYQYELSVAPGWKLGGWAPWSFSDPFPLICQSCGATMVPLLTISSGEWDGGSESWVPLEDLPAKPGGNPPDVTVGRGDNLQVYLCPADPDHPIETNLQ